MGSFYTPWKHQKTSGFQMFSGGIERVVAQNVLKSFQENVANNLGKVKKTVVHRRSEK